MLTLPHTHALTHRYTHKIYLKVSLECILTNF